MTDKLVEYNKELQPKIRDLLKKQQIVKEWAAEDETIAELKAQIKEMNENIKSHIEDKESQLVREIKDLQMDIKLALKGACKGTDLKPAEVKAYMFARAQDKVDGVLEKATLFSSLEELLA